MNHSLTVLKAFAEGFRDGGLPFWNESQFGGYSLVALPYQYPNPVPALAALLNVKDIYFFAGVEAAVLLALTGCTGYAFLRESGRSILSAAVGGVLYETSALTLLKVSQNDMSFLVVTLIPLLLLLIRRTVTRIRPFEYTALFLVSLVLMSFCFLQKVAYAGMMAVAYATWLAIRERTWRPIVAGCLAAFPAALISLPRVVTIARDFTQAVRHHSGGDSFSVAFSLTHVPGIHVLRWLDERIFGETFQQMAVLGNFLNLHEGVLLYATSYAPFLLLLAAVRGWWSRLDRDVPFFLVVVIISFSVIFYRPVFWLLWEALGQIDFIHARILLIAVISVSFLVSVAIDMLRDWAEKDAARAFPPYGMGVALTVGILAGLMVEAVAFLLPPKGPKLYGATLQSGALLRIGFAVVVLGLMAFALTARRLPAILTRLDKRMLPPLLCGLIIAQAGGYAVSSVWGPGRWEYPTVFKSPTRAMARPGEFRLPPPEVKSAVRGALESEAYRTAVICDRKITAVFCSSQVSNFWGLRSIDGYVSSLPERLAVMPWGSALGLRTIAFLSPQQLNWPLLGLLNVKHALTLVPGLITNEVRDKDGSHRMLRPEDLHIADNPAPVAERVFFAGHVRAVRDMEASVKALFPGGAVRPEGYDPARESYAEGLDKDRDFPGGAVDRAEFKGAYDAFSFAPSGQARFLVVNERYDKHWVAHDDSGRRLNIYPTNLFMRGVLVPPGIGKVTMEYRPFMVRWQAFCFYAGGALLMTAVLGVLFWRQRFGRQEV